VNAVARRKDDGSMASKLAQYNKISEVSQVWGTKTGGPLRLTVDQCHRHGITLSADDPADNEEKRVDRYDRRVIVDYTA